MCYNNDWIQNMGSNVSFQKCKIFISLTTRREIISEKSLKALLCVVDYLMLNAGNRNIFRESGYRRRVRQIAAYIATGNKNLPNFLVGRTPVEVSAGLQYYLLRLPEPLIPKYIQNLALDADLSIRPEIVASDMLGLISQDIQGRHYVLIAIIFEMLNFLKKHARYDEIDGFNVPITLLPVFITLQPYHLQQWRRIANIFMEMINLSPAFLNTQTRTNQLELASIPENTVDDLNLLQNELNEDRLEIEENDVVLHQVLEVKVMQI